MASSPILQTITHWIKKVLEVIWLQTKPYINFTVEIYKDYYKSPSLKKKTMTIFANPQEILRITMFSVDLIEKL